MQVIIISSLCIYVYIRDITGCTQHLAFYSPVFTRCRKIFITMWYFAQQTMRYTAINVAEFNVEEHQLEYFSQSNALICVRVLYAEVA